MASSGTASFRRQNQRARTKKRKKNMTKQAPPLQRRGASADLQLRAYPHCTRSLPERAVHQRPPPLISSATARSPSSSRSHRQITRVSRRHNARGHGHGSSVPDSVRAGGNACGCWSGPGRASCSCLLSWTPSGFLSDRLGASFVSLGC
jgi:hypothetical protein